MKRLSLGTLKNISMNEKGLLNSEVHSQRALYGSNDIVEAPGNFWWELLIETLKDPMIWFLVGIGSILFVTGAVSDGTTLFLAVVPLLFMDAFLHWQTQASTFSLKGQLSSRASVVREGQEIEIDSREVVPGDLVVLKNGTLLPADGIFQAAENIQTDESMLTGESLPISKQASNIDVSDISKKEEALLPEQFLGYAGTKVLRGQGLLRAVSTGQRTEYGEIIQSIVRMPRDRTPLQKSISRLVQSLIIVALAFCVFLALIRIYQGHGWLDALLSAAVLAIAAIPEEFPVVFSLFLGVGIYRLAKQGALVRRSVSVENIGRVTQVCTDKTGTITVGRLTLTHLDPMPGLSTEDLLWEGLAASNSDSDPLDIAIQQAAKERNLKAPQRVQVFPFTESRKRETCFMKSRQGNLVTVTKGAPEVLLGMSSLTDAEKQNWKKAISTWARGGHKVIAIARKNISSPSDLEPTSGYTFRGLLAFEDPHRPEVIEAMSFCHKNKIRVLMITGDHPDTAAAIARDANLSQNPIVISTEDDPEKFEESWLHANPDFLKSLNVVARCSPLQKLRIVSALKKSGEIVAVTGDGINDVPALKAADVGIAMGERGTRGAKEVSSIILADDNFATIVRAIREGRQLFLNLKMSFEYLFLIHIPLVLTAALLPLIGYPLAYLPVHIVWLELIIHPTALLAFQSQITSVVPINGGKSFFSWEKIITIGVGCLIVTTAMILSFHWGLREGLSEEHVRTKALASLILWSAGITLYLTKLRIMPANFMATGTILSTLFLIHFSEKWKSLHLITIGSNDWLEIASMVFLAIFSMEITRRALIILKRKFTRS